MITYEKFKRRDKTQSLGEELAMLLATELAH